MKTAPSLGLTLLFITATLPLRAAEPPPPPEAVAVAAEKAPEIDGELDDALWLAASSQPGAALTGWKHLASGKHPARLAPQQRITYLAWDDEALYIGMQAYVADLAHLRSDQGGNPFLGDCLEVHLNVPGREYFQFGVDFEGKTALGTAAPGTDGEAVRAATAMGDQFWTAELAIPWKILGVKPEKGMRLGLALSANHASQDGTPGVMTHLHWGRAFNARKTTSNLLLQ